MKRYINVIVYKNMKKKLYKIDKKEVLHKK